MRAFVMILLASATLTLGGCADKAPLGDASSLASVPVYRLGPGDELRITVFNEDRLSGQFTVASDGNVSFRLLGPVPVVGSTVEQLQGAIAGRLASEGLLVNPLVTAQLTQSRPFYIRGEIGRPGRYPTGEHLTLQEAITLAGDYTYRANRRYVYLRREGSKEEIKLPVTSDFQVQPGDIIRIGERYF